MSNEKKKKPNFEGILVIFIASVLLALLLLVFNQEDKVFYVYISLILALIAWVLRRVIKASKTTGMLIGIVFMALYALPNYDALRYIYNSFAAIGAGYSKFDASPLIGYPLGIILFGICTLATLLSWYKKPKSNS